PDKPRGLTFASAFASSLELNGEHLLEYLPDSNAFIQCFQGLSECGPQASSGSIKEECIRYISSPHPKPEEADSPDIQHNNSFSDKLSGPFSSHGCFVAVPESSYQTLHITQTLFYEVDKEHCIKYKGEKVMPHGTRKNKANRMEPDRSYGQDLESNMSHRQSVKSTIPRYLTFQICATTPSFFASETTSYLTQRNEAHTQNGSQSKGDNRE
ncbi:hypothetical protein STEG23_037827, partial [Scotinomys teguina]